jgi:hypothetical protein
MTAADIDIPGVTTTDLLTIVRRAIDYDPRSLQVAIGPSELGTPCDRRLLLKMLGATVHNTGTDKWPATVGTAIHAWLADVFTADNASRVADGRPPRWLIEQRVTMRPGLSGSCDLYDMETHSVLDWKSTGVTRLRAYKKAGHPGAQYRSQTHLYGMGWARLGLPVQTVGAVFLPRSGELRDTWMWTEPYDQGVAQEAMDRADRLLFDANVADLDGRLDDMMANLPRDTSMCDFCDYYTPSPTVKPSDGCRGPLEDLKPGEAPQVQSVPGLF